ncbi:sugar phosphate isomerase/epimerase [Novosphingobium sp. P6W]|uniref:sugar phosphate isomerase/epimerase family protein n=1 Tax=Novosphingobium sp. P6W TaxID=1609758 RepID=UPI000ADC4FD0|nr:TIM barrel protein [Novosphingobium sp. P6W]
MAASASKRFCLDHLSLANVDALTLVRSAASAGFAKVSLFVSPVSISPTPDVTRGGAELREVQVVLRDEGLRLGIAEPCLLDSHPDWEALKRRAALAAELGGSVNILGMDNAPVRLRRSLERMVEICREVGAGAIIEAYPLSAVPTVHDALRHVEALRPDVGLCADTLHVIRGGGRWSDIAALPPQRIAHVQVSDGPLNPPADCLFEAVFDRHLPGSGSFGLHDLTVHSRIIQWLV